MALLYLKTEIERILERNFHSDELFNLLIQSKEIDQAIRRFETCFEDQS